MSGKMKLAKNIFFTNFKRLKLPYKLTLIVTYNCNLRCRMCNIWKRPVENEFTLEEYEKFFTYANSFNWVNLSGGEIFLRPDLLDVVKIIKRNCKDLFLLDFPTAGLMTDKVVRSVDEILTLNPGKLLVTISMDGPPDLHNEIRGIPGAWDKATDTFLQLRKIKARNFGVYFGTTISGFNQDRFFETFEALKKKIPYLTYKDIHINIAHSSDHYYGNESTVTAENQKTISLVDEFIRKKGFSVLDPVSLLEYSYLKKSKGFLNTGKRPMCCQALEASVFIDPHGNVYPCSIYDRKVGNLRDANYKLSDIWLSREAVDLRNEIVKGACPHCWTPCEAYQAIFANILPLRKIKGER